MQKILQIPKSEIPEYGTSAVDFEGQRTTDFSQLNASATIYMFTFNLQILFTE